MAKGRFEDGVESLSSITARAASARVLDLHAIARSADDDPDHDARPLFAHPVLNRTIIAKHHPRPGEFGPESGAPSIVTKVIFPFDGEDLDLGGVFLLAGAKVAGMRRKQGKACGLPTQAATLSPFS